MSARKVNQRRFGVEKKENKRRKIKNKSRRSMFDHVAILPLVSTFLGMLYT